MSVASPAGDVRLLGPAEIRDLAARLGLVPTKRLGQNFVHEPNTVRRIVRTADLSPHDIVVEVGPGLGSLTLGLLPAARQVIAIEIDPRLAQALPHTAAAYAPSYADRLHVVTADALRIRNAALPAAPTALVANLPYNVAVPVILHLLAELPTLAHGLVMVQREVAERLVATAGGRQYGAPTVKLAWYAQVRAAGRVPPTVFWPVPNVDSELVRFTRRPPPAPPLCRTEIFTVVDAAFAQRRKTLRSALAGWAGSTAAAEHALAKAGVPTSARAEQLTINQFAAIAAARPR